MISRLIMATGLLLERLLEICRASISKMKTENKSPLKSGNIKTSLSITKALNGLPHQESIPSKWNQMEHTFKTIAILSKQGRSARELYFLCMVMDALQLITHSQLNYLRKMDMSFVELTKKVLERVKELGAESKTLVRSLMTQKSSILNTAKNMTSQETHQNSCLDIQWEA